MSGLWKKCAFVSKQSSVLFVKIIILELDFSALEDVQKKYILHISSHVCSLSYSLIICE